MIPFFFVFYIRYFKSMIQRNRNVEESDWRFLRFHNIMIAMCYYTSQELMRFPRTFQEESWEKVLFIFVLYSNVNENLYVEYFVFTWECTVCSNACMCGSGWGLTTLANTEQIVLLSWQMNSAAASFCSFSFSFLFIIRILHTNITQPLLLYAAQPVVPINTQIYTLHISIIVS